MLHLVVIAVSLFAADLYGPPREVATIDIPELNESSGLAVSAKHPGVLWSHNDSGDGAFLYGFTRSGMSLGRWKVRNATNSDWEDLAIGPGPGASRTYLYIGDIGDNSGKRKNLVVYRVEEPDPESASRETRPAEPIRLRYPGPPHDAEALMVHPQSGDLYIVTKARGADGATGVYVARAPLRAGREVVLRHLADIPLPNQSAFTLLIGRITGGAIAPDGRRVALCDYFGGWEAELKQTGARFDSIWQAEWRPVNLGKRPQGESVAYSADGRSILSGSEGAPMKLWEVVRSK